MGLCRRPEGLVARQIDGEFVLLDTESEQIHQLNQTASFIWQACDGVTAETVAKAVATEFDVEEGVAMVDVLEAINRLKALRLVVEAE